MSNEDDTRAIIMARRQFFITSALAGVALAACERGQPHVCLEFAPVGTAQPTGEPSGQPSATPPVATPAPSTSTTSAAPPTLPPSVCLEIAPQPRACLDVAPPDDTE